MNETKVSIQGDDGEWREIPGVLSFEIKTTPSPITRLIRLGFTYPEASRLMAVKKAMTARMISEEMTG